MRDLLKKNTEPILFTDEFFSASSNYRYGQKGDFQVLYWLEMALNSDSIEVRFGDVFYEKMLVFRFAGGLKAGGPSVDVNPVLLEGG
ncbi:MAG: hypothetical protein OQK97_06520 [Deltaproteobacteria bacterium]|jgi:hypothetical protein|nr:hypothetical protein [Deltaproteobacteria bacterium]MCW8892209.1 hypothetical protein [Deltaproteobacteria bacterium]